MSRLKNLLPLLFIFFFISQFAVAQQDSSMLKVRGFRLTISENSSIYVNGNVKIDENSFSDDNIHVLGKITITDTLFNSVDSLFLTSSVPGKDNDSTSSGDDDPLGKVIFQSNKNKLITGNSSIYLNDLTVKLGQLSLDTNIIVFGEIELDQGNLDLNSNYIDFFDLDETINQKGGKIKSGTETNDYKIFDDSTGYIKAVKYYDTIPDPANLGFAVYNPINTGELFITRFHNSDTSVTDGSIKKSYCISLGDTSSNLGNEKEFLQFNYFDSDLHGELINNDSSIRIFHKNLLSNRYTYLGGSIDTSNRSVKVRNVNFNEGYYTIADSICNNPPAVNLGPDQNICEDGEIDLDARAIYDDDQEEKMTYEWWSPDFDIDNPDNLRMSLLEISSTTINNNLNQTLTIRLKVADERGCINYDTIQFFTFQNPEIGIKVSSPNSNICMGDTVTFLDTINSVGDYKWHFIEENYHDSIVNPSYVFQNQSGGKDIKVDYTDLNGCLDDTTVHVIVHALPEPSFIVDAESCLGQELLLDNKSYIYTAKGDAISKYTWNLGNGNQIEVTQHDIVSDSTLAFLTDTITDVGGIPGPGLSYYYNQTGIYDINLTAESFAGCIYDTTVTTQIYDSVYAAFDTTSFTNVCLGLESRFFPRVGTSDTNLVAEYQWHFNDTVIIANYLDDTVNYTFETYGLNEVSFVAVSKHGCSDTTTQMVNIYPSPIAIFTVNPVCLTNPSKFNSKGSSNNGSTLDYTWYFTDTTIYSSPGTLVNYTFDSEGKHGVMLEVSYSNGCSATYSDSAIVAGNPEANFTVKDACINNQEGDTLIINTSNNSNSTYNWDFGDGTISEIEQPFKAYKNANKYTVRLEAITEYDINGYELTCKSIYVDSLEIFDIAPADFYVDENTNVCEGNNSVFMLADFTNAGFVDYYEWHFESDTVVFNTDPVNYQFDSDGNYNVTLKTVTNHGCIDDTIKTITIYDTPVASIISDSVCVGEELVFSIPESDRDMYTTYNWYLGEEHEHIGSGWYANVNKSVAGVYELILNAESQNGCTSKDTSYAVVHELPLDLFQPEIDACSDTFQLVGENTDYDYLWNGSILSNEYIVRTDEICTVEKTNKITGCQSTESIQVSLNKPLNVDLGNDTSVCGSIELDAGYFGQSATYSWSNGETGRYTNANASGEYKVTVFQGDCFASDSVFITVNSQPVVDLGTDIEACAFETVNLNAEITDGFTYLWSNGSTLSNIDIASGVAQSGNYRVTVTDINSCVATDQVKVTFNSVPNVDLGADIETCQNNDIALNATVASASSYLWNTGEVSSVIYPVEYANEVINKIYSVRVKNTYGCESYDTITVQFNPVPEVLLQDVVACGNEKVTLSAYIPGAISYSWNNGSVDSVLTINPEIDGEGIYYVTVENQYNCISTSNQSNVTFRTAPTPVLPDEITGCNEITLDAGNFGAEFLWNDNITTQSREIYQSGLYTVEITNGNNCTIIDSVEATVNYVTKPYLGPDISMCTNDQKVLRTGIHDPEYTFEWNGYSTGDTMLVATPGTYIVRAIHDNGCEDSDTIEVIGRSLPEVDLGPDMYKCTNDNFILDAGNDGFAYYWGSDNGLEANSRLVEVSDTGKYWVQVTNDYGCVQSDTILIKPTSLSIDPMFVVNSELIAGDSVLFVDMSQPEPLSWLWEFGDLQQSILQNPVHVYYGGGSYQVILHVSNSVCNASIIKIIEVEHRNKSGDEDEEEPGIFGDNFIEIQDVKIYPNPNNGNFTIEAELSTRTNANVYIFDLMGRLISVRKYSNVKILNQYVDIQSKSSGIYIIKIIAGTDHKTYKIIKQ